MLVKVIVPARFTPLGDVALVNLTPTVQLSPGTRVVPVQVSGIAAFAALKNHVDEVPPETAKLLTVVCAPVPAGAVLVSVTVAVPVLVPLGRVIVSGLGVMDTVALAATPVPVRATGDPVTVAPV